MVAREIDHYQILRNSMREHAEPDETVAVSLEVLTQRLENLKQRHPLFEGVGFSPDVERMASRVMTPVG